MTIPTLNTHTRWALALAAVVVAGFTIEHFRDSHRDAELVKLHQTIAADSATRTAAVAATNAASTTLDTSSHAAARADTAWRNAAATSIARIDTIIVSTKADTVKIRELVQVDSSLIIKGNALADTTQQLRAAAVSFQLQAMQERASWSTERTDEAIALATSESEHKHWGLGCTAGGGVVRGTGGALVAGPGVMCGVTYRW